MIGAARPNVACAVHTVKRSRSASGTPIISQMTVDGTGSARSAITSISPRGGDAVEALVDDPLDRRAQRRDRRAA